MELKRIVSATGFEGVEGNLPPSLSKPQFHDILYIVTVKNNSMQSFFCWVCVRGLMPEALQPIVLIGKWTSLAVSDAGMLSFSDRVAHVSLAEMKERE